MVMIFFFAPNCVFLSIGQLMAPVLVAHNDPGVIQCCGIVNKIRFESGDPHVFGWQPSSPQHSIMISQSTVGDTMVAAPVGI